MHWFKNRLKSPLWGWIESLLITVLAILAGIYFSPADPFFLNASFPWIWIASVLIGLRYGMGPALFSTMIIVTAYFLEVHHRDTVDLGIKFYFLGGVILTMICAEFSTLWSNRVRQATQHKDHAEQRLDQLTKMYYIAKISHDRLEQNLIAKPTTLRSALLELRTILTKHQGELTPSIANRFLQLLVQYCSIDNAAIFLMQHGILDDIAIAETGLEITLNKDDPLVINAIEKHEPCYYTLNQLSGQQKTDYLACAPMVRQDGKVMGIVLIKEMPFLAFQHETLQVLSLLINYFVNDIWAIKQAKYINEIYPSCPPEFAAELTKLMEIKKKFDFDSALIAFIISPNKYTDSLISQHFQQIRGLDYAWHHQAGGKEILVTLMPFAGQLAIEGFLERKSDWLKEIYGLALNTKAIYAHSQLLSGNDPVTVLDNLLDIKNET